MKYCIVNGDDFGAHAGINRGVYEAHEHGILTSTSLMMNMPGTEEAARLGRATPSLSVGIHLHLEGDVGGAVADPTTIRAWETDLGRQMDQFGDLMGRSPTHIDSHHNIHRLPALRPLFLELARRSGLPLRENSPVRYFSSFYGQWGGETHAEQISVPKLLEMLATEIGEGFTELSCHPGYVDASVATGYAIEREIELATLCDRRVRSALDELDIRLIGYQALGSLLEEAL